MFGLADFLDRGGVGFVDSIAEEYADAERVGLCALVPPVLQHVGKKSSKGDYSGEGARWRRSVAQTIRNSKYQSLDQSWLEA